MISEVLDLGIKDLGPTVGYKVLKIIVLQVGWFWGFEFKI